ncbi:Os01g0519050, partial [Oryza sativa Japonica Group]
AAPLRPARSHRPCSRAPLSVHARSRFSPCDAALGRARTTVLGSPCGDDDGALERWQAPWAGGGRDSVTADPVMGRAAAAKLGCREGGGGRSRGGGLGGGGSVAGDL